MAQVSTATTVGVSLTCEKPWTTSASRTELTRTMAESRRGIKGYVGHKVFSLPSYPIFKPISLPASWSYYILNSAKDSRQSGGSLRYSVIHGAHAALKKLIESCGNAVPAEFVQYQTKITFSSPSSKDRVLFPCPLKEQDAIAAIKALEACAAAAIADLRWHKKKEGRQIKVDLNKSACFLMSAYLTTVGGMDKTDPRVKRYIHSQSPSPCP